MALTLNINGQMHRVECDPTVPLLDVLRNDLGLTGTRFGCGEGQCGACHVMIDGRSVASCSTEVGTLAGKAIRTIEGLSQGDARHPLQQAFIDEQAMQCGYCLSGIQISAAALLQSNPNPTDAEILKALDPHLCRCGTHARILRAVRRARRG